MLRRTGTITLVLMAALLAGCSSIGRVDTFHPCVDPSCPRCLGHRTIRCTACQGRGSVSCTKCNGGGTLTCSRCHGKGTRDGKSCKDCNHNGRAQCTGCQGRGTAVCRTCNGTGMIPCGVTTTYWVCNECGERFDYSAKSCPRCKAEKEASKKR